MTATTARPERRTRRDFPEPGAATGLLWLLADLPQRAGYDGDALASERVQAAVVLAASGNLARLRQMLDLATADWRDALVAAELADEDWQQRLDIELGPGLKRYVVCLPLTAATGADGHLAAEVLPRSLTPLRCALV